MEDYFPFGMAYFQARPVMLVYGSGIIPRNSCLARGTHGVFHACLAIAAIFGRIAVGMAPGTQQSRESEGNATPTENKVLLGDD